MSTFKELQDAMTSAKFKRTVIQHLIEYVDSNFRPIAGGDPKNKLMTDEKIPVPPAVFEAVVSELLVKADGELEARMTEILASSIQGTEVVEEKKTKKVKQSTPKEVKS